MSKKDMYCSSCMKWYSVFGSPRTPYICDYCIRLKQVIEE